MAPFAAVGDVGDGARVGVDVGTGVGVDVLPLVLLPPQATSRTARIRLHIASADHRVKCFNRVNIVNFIRDTPKLSIVHLERWYLQFSSPLAMECIRKSLSL